MFSAVLAHLRHHHSDWMSHVVSARGRHTAFFGVATDSIIADAESMSKLQAGSYGKPQTRPGLLSPLAQTVVDQFPVKFDNLYEHVWPECTTSYADSPSTKAAYCIRELFGLPIVPDLLKYSIRVDHDRREAVDRYVNSLPVGKFAVIHANGTTSGALKDMHASEVGEMCDFLAARGITPVILDDADLTESRVEKTVRIGYKHDLWRGWETGCAATIAALMERAAVTVCIDSGPGKVALAVSGTPALQVWRHMHPIHYCDYAPHAVHLIPPTHIYHVRGDVETGLKFFRENYRHVIYDPNALGKTAGMMAWRLANGIPLAKKEGDDGIVVSEPPRPTFAVHVVGGLQPAETPAFVVGVPTLNRTDLLRLCLQSIFASKDTPENIIVIDNGGKLPADFYAGQCTVIRPEKNLGVATSWNMLRRLADPLPLIILNDDVTVQPDTFAKMLAVPEPFVAASGWSCFTQTHDLWRQVGDYDEAFYPAYHEDGDYCWRMKLAGVTPFELDCGVVHVGSATRKQFTADEEAVFRQAWEAGHERFQRKWGNLPGLEIFSTPFNKPL